MFAGPPSPLQAASNVRGSGYPGSTHDISDRLRPGQHLQADGRNTRFLVLFRGTKWTSRKEASSP